MLTCKITLPDSPHPVIISKNPGFRALYRARQDKFRFCHLINTEHFFHFWLLASARKIYFFLPQKIMFLPEPGGCSPSGSYTYGKTIYLLGVNWLDEFLQASPSIVLICKWTLSHYDDDDDDDDSV